MAVAGNLGGEFQEIDNLIDGLALLIPLDLGGDLEIAGGVLPCGEGRRGAQEAELGGQFARVDGKQRAIGGGGVEFHLERADDLDVAALRLDIERADFTGREFAATGAHRLLEGEQDRARAEDGAGQRDDDRIALAAPIAADVLAGDVDVADAGGNGDSPLGGGCADDEVVHQHAAVCGSGFQRVEVENIGLDALAERLDGERDLPSRFAEAECLLEAGGLAGEEGDGHFGNAGGLPCDEAVAGRGHRADVSAVGFRIGESERLELPCTGLRRLVFLKADFNELAVDDRFPENDFQAAHAVLRLGGKGIIGHLRTGDGGDGVVGGDIELPLADGCLADVELKAGDDAAVRFREFIDGDFGDADLGKDLIRLELEGVHGGREAIHENLAERGVVAAGELVRGELDEAFRIRDLDADRAVIGNADEAAVAQRADRRDAQGFHFHGESAKRGACLDDDALGLLNGAGELEIEGALAARFGNGPCEHRLSVDREDLAGAFEGEGKRREFSLEHAQIERGELPHQSGADADVGGGGGGEEQGAIGGGVRFAEGERCGAVRRKEAAPCGTVLLWHDGEAPLKGNAFGKAFEGQRDHDSGGQPEAEREPIAFPDERHDELDGDGEIARGVGDEFVSVGFC